MGTGTGQPSPYGVNPGMQQHPDPENATYGTAPPAGFTGVASPYYQNSGGNPAGTKQVPAAVFILTLACRMGALVLSLVALSLLASAKQTQDYVEILDSTQFFSVTYTALGFGGGRYLTSMSILVLIYEIGNIVLAFLGRVQPASWISGFGGSLATYILDQVLAYLVFSASSALAQQVTGWKQQTSVDIPALVISCTGWNSWCTKIQVAVAMGYLAFACLAAVSALSAARFFRVLYAGT